MEEARARALEELLPKALKVLSVHLGNGKQVNPDAWRAALRVFEYAFGRPPEQVEEVSAPEDPLDVAKMTPEEREKLKAQLLRDHPHLRALNKPA